MRWFSKNCWEINRLAIKLDEEDIRYRYKYILLVRFCKFVRAILFNLEVFLLVIYYVYNYFSNTEET